MVLRVPGRRLPAAALSRSVRILLGLAAAIFLTHAFWIPAKAELAQVLLDRSWQAHKAGAGSVPPWPWADTRAVASLHVPRLGQQQLVLDAPSGRSLAFGPVLAAGTGGDRVVFGHRDTHFRYLENLRIGDQLAFEDRNSIQSYRVSQINIIDSRHQSVDIHPGKDRLTLVTCYPFDALQANGPLRYVVTAVPMGEGVGS